MTHIDRDVLIVDAGPVGLAAAIELGRRGVSCIVVGRNDRIGCSPRAKTTDVRTDEHLRRRGVEQKLRAASPIRPDYPSRIVFATRMNRSLLARSENARNGSRARNDRCSAAARWIPQYIAEDVLRQHAATIPDVTVRLGAEFRSVSESDDLVTVELADVQTGAIETVRSRYAIGADGARSSVRDAIGAKMVGDTTAVRNCSIILRAPSRGPGPRPAKRSCTGWSTATSGPCWARRTPPDSAGLRFFMATKIEPGIGQDAIDLIRRGTGLYDLDIGIVGNDLWNARQLLAGHDATRRIFLAGDRCHLHPPFGGFGMNMGIMDSVDFGWKIAAVIQGWGGPGALATCQTERRVPHDRTIADLIRLVKAREFRILGLVPGMRCADSPIVPDAGHVAPPEHPMICVSSSRPGCLAPPLRLEDGSSPYDRFLGTGFTLVGTHEDAGAVETLVSAVSELDVPLAIFLSSDERLRRRYAAARYTLIRSDQHVSWRGDSIPDDPGALLACMTGHLAVPMRPVTIDRRASVTAVGD